MPELASATVDAAAAICRLQAKIQVYTCFSCHGHGKQAMVLEPYASLPCARCHGEGVTHDVPPGRYDAVLTALLDALGGAGVGRITERLRPLIAEPGAVGETAEPAAFGPHRVRIYARKPAHVPDFHVRHPADCDALRYGEQCWFDELAETAVEFRNFDGWPEAGEYTATPPGEGEMAIRFTPTTDNKEN